MSVFFFYPQNFLGEAVYLQNFLGETGPPSPAGGSKHHPAPSLLCTNLHLDQRPSAITLVRIMQDWCKIFKSQVLNCVACSPFGQCVKLLNGYLRCYINDFIWTSFGNTVKKKKTNPVLSTCFGRQLKFVYASLDGMLANADCKEHKYKTTIASL